MYKNKIFINQKFQQYFSKWYHTYLLHTRWDRAEVMICKQFYFPDIRNVSQKEVTECEVCQHTKQLTKTFGQLPAKLPEEIPWNKLCVYIIDP